MNLRVIPIKGEPTRYHVEGKTLVCSNCQKFEQRELRNLNPGDPCPRCGGVLEARFHLVDLAEFDTCGWCNCERYSFEYGPKIAKMSKAQRLASWHLVCSHIETAQKFYAHARLLADETYRKEQTEKESAF